MPRTMARRTKTPPTTPPAIAPTGTCLAEVYGAGSGKEEGDCDAEVDCVVTSSRSTSRTNRSMLICELLNRGSGRFFKMIS